MKRSGQVAFLAYEGSLLLYSAPSRPSLKLCHYIIILTVSCHKTHACMREGEGLNSWREIRAFSRGRAEIAVLEWEGTREAAAEAQLGLPVS